MMSTFFGSLVKGIKIAREMVLEASRVFRQPFGLDRPSIAVKSGLSDSTSGISGNAVGIGLADLTTRRVLEKVDMKATAKNSLTSGRPWSARLPIGLADDRTAL